MNWDTVEGQWNQIKGAVKSKWGKLTDDDLTALGGKRDKLVGKLQELYGYSKDQAERELDTWADSRGESSGGKKSPEAPRSPVYR